MKICIADMHGKPVMLELKDGVVYIDGEPEPIKNVTQQELEEFQANIDALPHSDDPGYPALINSIRAAFIAKLLSKAVGDETIDHLTHILDHVHYEVLQYLGETED